MLVDFQPLLQGAVFSLVSTKMVGERRVSLFLLNKQLPLSSAVEAVELLLQQNPGLIPIFSMSDLSDRLANNCYLVLNDRRVCLKNIMQTPLASLADCFDKYFSEEMMTVPVKCSNNQHVFDYASFEYYRANYRGLDGTPSDQHPCPGETENDPHLIGDGNADQALQDRIDQIRQNHQTQEQSVQIFMSRLLTLMNEEAKGLSG